MTQNIPMNKISVKQQVFNRYEEAKKALMNSWCSADGYGPATIAFIDVVIDHWVMLSNTGSHPTMRVDYGRHQPVVDRIIAMRKFIIKIEDENLSDAEILLAKLSI